MPDITASSSIEAYAAALFRDDAAREAQYIKLSHKLDALYNQKTDCMNALQSRPEGVESIYLREAFGKVSNDILIMVAAISHLIDNGDLEEIEDILEENEL